MSENDKYIVRLTQIAISRTMFRFVMYSYICTLRPCMAFQACITELSQSL